MIARLNKRLSWMNRDARLITAARGTRTFSQSFISVIVALYLAEMGFNLVQIGAILSVGIAGVSFFAFVVGLTSGTVGRRRLLVVFSLLAAASGLAMYFAETFIPLMVIAFLGSLSTGGGGGGESPGPTAGSCHSAGYRAARKAHGHFRHLQHRRPHWDLPGSAGSRAPGPVPGCPWPIRPVVVQGDVPGLCHMPGCRGSAVLVHLAGG